ncbi:MAG: hypothetical protein IJT14_02410 [Rickettsiales bacterium]|nr:hypothetical protein [Rickettsiales bacterium]
MEKVSKNSLLNRSVLSEKVRPIFYVALPEATPSPFGTATLLLAVLGGQMRSAPRNKSSLLILANKNPCFNCLSDDY